MAQLVGGPRVWSGSQDSEGHRTYRIAFLVQVETGEGVAEGPAAAMRCPGLPAPGDFWSIDGDADAYGWFRFDMDCQPHGSVEGSPIQYFNVIMTASTKPLDPSKERDPAAPPIEDPLAEPPRVSGSFVKTTEEATHDMYGLPIEYSSHEQIRGPQVEFDAGFDSVRIEQNVPQLQLYLLASLRNCVNLRPLWGMPERTIRFACYSWTRVRHGNSFYYQRVLEFEVNINGFDREVLDESSKVLKGRWATDGVTGKLVWQLVDVAPGEPADRDNPAHYIAAIDPKGNPARILLDGRGTPYIPTKDGVADANAREGKVTTTADPVIAPIIYPNNTYYRTLAGGDLTLSRLTSSSHYYAFAVPKNQEGRIVARLTQGDLDHFFIEVFADVDGDGNLLLLGDADKYIIDPKPERVANAAAYAYSTGVIGEANVRRAYFGTGGFATSFLVVRVTYTPFFEFDAGAGVVVSDVPEFDATYTLRLEAAAEDDPGPGRIVVQKYRSADLLLLNLPTDF
jgi:hypothetical protein